MAIDISSQHRLVVDQPPACLAFCPSRPELFVVGGYVLHPASTSTTNVDQVGAAEEEEPTEDGSREENEGGQKRTGSLSLFRIQDDEMHHLSTLPLDSAVLDAQFSPHNPSLLALATSTGQVIFYTVSPNPERPRLSLHSLHSLHAVAEPSVLILSLSWHPSDPNILGCTFSNGNVALFTATDSSWSSLTPTSLPPHDLEPWHLAFQSPTSLLTGGDDGVLQLCQRDDDGSWTSIWRDRKLHSAGVTAILPLPGTELVVTGCYDDRVRLMACPAAGRRNVLAEEDMGGGVWRLRKLQEEWVSKEGGEREVSSLALLASCMHSGSRVVRLHRDAALEWQFTVLARFTEHSSMNYGSEVQPGVDGKDTSVKTIVSTSFYDKLMCLWRVDLAELGVEVGGE